MRIFQIDHQKQSSGGFSSLDTVYLFLIYLK